jgi:general secretion pathway protein D
MRTSKGWRYALVFSVSLAWVGTVAAKDAPAGWITLNFVNADIGSVIKAMSEMTKRTFVVDPRVKGTINITSPRPVAPSVAYDILLAALRMQGYSAVQSDGVVRIVPEADAKFYAATATTKPRRGKTGGEMATRVFPLRHESAVQLLAALRPLVGANSAINADAGTNTLLVTDYADNLARLEQVITNLDVPSADEPVLIPLKYASAQNIAALVTRVFTASVGQATGSVADVPQVAVDDRSNSLIVRARDRSLVGKVQNLAATLDVPTPVAGNVHVIYLKNAQAVEVAKTLRNILNADTTALTQPAAPAKTAGAQDSSGPGMIQADAATNALIITAPEAVFNNLKSVVEKLDVRRAQVLIEALIAEVSADKAAQFGIQWMHLTSNGVIGGFGNSGSNNIGSVAANPANATQGFNLGLVRGKVSLGEPTNTFDPTTGVLTSSTPAATLYNLGVLASALETDANANILSTPSILTLDNEEAKISVGSNVPFQTGSYSITSGTSASPFTTIERKDVGLILKVKPQISEGGTVRLAIAEEVSSVQGSGGVLAATNKRSIDTTVLIDDGQIVVLGGLIETQVQDTEDKVPLLGDIPWLGNLFRYSNRTHKKTNLMVFLRPKIIRDATAAAAVTDPRYDYIVGVQKAGTPPHKVMLPDVPVTTLPEYKAGDAVPRQDKKMGDAVPSQDKPTADPKPVDVKPRQDKPQSDDWWAPQQRGVVTPSQDKSPAAR